MSLVPGVPTTDHWRVGRDFQILSWEPFPAMVRMRGPRHTAHYSMGRCVSVTPWGNGNIRWVRLQHHDGSQKSYAPSALREVPDGPG